MSAETDITLALLNELGEAGLQLARRSVGSQALREAMRFERLTRTSGRLYVPHYWAVYHHDGRGRVTPKSAVLLVWFVDPADDPRLEGGYPVTLKDVRQLTRDEFLDGLQRNQQLYNENPAGGRQQFMIVREVSGPTRPTKSYPFFTKGMRAFPGIAKEIIERFIMARLQELDVGERSTVRIKL